MDFHDAFSNISMNEDLDEAFEGISVDKVIMSKSSRIVTLKISGKKTVERKYLLRMARTLKAQVFTGVYDAQIKFEEHYDLGDASLSDIYEEYKQNLLEELTEMGPVYRTCFESAKITIDGNTFTIEAYNDFFTVSRISRIADYLRKVFKERFGVNADVRTFYKPREREDTDDGVVTISLNEIEANAINQRNKVAPKKGKNDGADTVKMPVAKKEENKPTTTDKKFYRKPKLPDDPDIFYGKPFAGEMTKLHDIQGEMGEVVVRGKVMTLDERPIKNEKTILIFTFTDFTDSITGKIFVRNEELDEIRPNLAEGSFIKLKGVAMMDSFEREVAISSITGIKKIDDFTVKRMDNAKVKRVELHLHTIMSEMDACVNTKPLLKQLSEWGHKAVAITDHGVVQSLTDAFHAKRDMKMNDFKLICGCEAYIVDDTAVTTDINNIDVEYIQKNKSYHCILLAKNVIGRINLYKLISESHLKYFHRRPRIPKSLLAANREGIIIGSACCAGEMYQAILNNEGEERIKSLCDFYDYYEIQPIGNDRFMIDDNRRTPQIKSDDDLIAINKEIVRLGEVNNKPVVATCDVHFQNPEDEVYRRMILNAKGMGAEEPAPLYLRTTEEMLEEFSYLGEEKAYEVVVTNSNLVADMIDNINPVRPDKCPPKIENSDEMLRDICYNRAHELYGENLPEPVSARLEKELTSIISNGYSVLYIIAQKLVWKSNEDGYLVGSRGSVGSSFVAFMAGITEVNSLPAHYRCAKCFYTDFDSEEVKSYGGRSGCDMPDKVCPVCGEPLVKEGHDIPFETFLGFNGDKEPDIDLNFSGEYQSKAHAYTEVIFGEGQTFKAGTIGGVADKTAYGYVLKYNEEHGINTMRKSEITRISQGCIGVKRTTGQHPGGIVVLPIGEKIYTFTPVQHPANDMSSPIVTTHFDYHSIDHNLLKLDILGHDDPTMIRMLEDVTGFDATEIRMDDPGVLALFHGLDSLKIKPEDIDGIDLGTLGVPEFGTKFVMQMLRDTKPTTFSELVRISGLSHGTNVWLDNAQTLIEEGKCTLSTAICTRDDIMIYLIQKGLDKGHAFKIMESVRKGRGLKPEMETEMIEHGVPDWYIWSCKRIKYMFPKAHAVAYVTMGLRIAYYKVHYPLAYYAAFFSIRAKAFNYEVMCMGREKLDMAMREIKGKGKDASPKELDMLGDGLLVAEMYARGFEFLPIDLYKAKAKRFQIIDGKLMPSFVSIDGLGDTAAIAMEEAVKHGEFVSKNDLKQRAKLSQTNIDKLDELGILGNLPESNQISLTDFLTEAASD